MIYVVETVNGVVSQVKSWLTPQKDDAELFAKQLCEENGIVYEGVISCDGGVANYSVQIWPSQ